MKQIKGLKEKSEKLGMQTFDGTFIKLFNEGRISKEMAIKNADSENNVRLKIELGDGVPVVDDSADTEKSSAFSGLSLLEREEDDDSEETYMQS